MPKNAEFTFMEKNSENTCLLLEKKQTDFLKNYEVFQSVSQWNI